MEQLCLFQEEEPAGGDAECLLGGKKARTMPMEEWMKELVPDGKCVVMVGEHPLVLRKAKGGREEVQEGHEFYHYMIGSQLYAGVFVGVETV